jgi:hypothetical protein
MPESQLIEPIDAVDEPIPNTERAPCGRFQALIALDHAVTSLGADEVLVLARIAHRLQGGTKVYGPLRLASDPRDFRGKEAREELEDALVYLACAWLKADGV